MQDDANEQFIVVDGNDRILSYRSRFDCHHDRTLIHRSTGILVTDGDRYLLQKRSPTKDLQPGKWAISVGGHVARGETYEETARREAFEELGIRVESLHVRKRFVFRGTEETEMATLFLCEHPGPFRIAPDEVSEVRFFTKEEIRNGAEDGSLDLSECARATLAQIGILEKSV